jgi:hypothetical protein
MTAAHAVTETCVSQHKTPSDTCQSHCRCATPEHGLTLLLLSLGLMIMVQAHALEVS